MTPRSPRWRPLLLVWLALSVLSGLWSIATPIAAAPDEPAHFIKAASVVRGQFIGESSHAGSIVRVPEWVARTQAVTCYAFHPEVTAACSPADPNPSDAIVDSTTTAGLYNPMYYLLTGWPSLLFHDATGLYAMRIVSDILSSLFLAIGAVQLLSLRRRMLPFLGFAVAVTPMLLFLDGSENPNSLEAAAALATFITMYMVVRHHDPRLVPARAMTVLVTAGLGVTMRGLSPLWIALALFAPLLLLRADTAKDLVRSKWAWVTTAGLAVIAAFAIVWILVTNSLGSAFVADGNAAVPGTGATPAAGFAVILFGTFGYAKGLIGVFGWLDTPSPLAVFFAWAGFFGALFLVSVAVTRGRARAMVQAAVGALVVLPPLLQAVYIHNGGIIWQGRYGLPLFVCVVLTMALLASEQLPELSIETARALAIAVAAAWSLSQCYAFATALRRYSVGLTGSIGAFLRDPSWSPPLGVLPLLVLFGVVAGLCGAALVVTSTARMSTPIPTDRAPQPAAI